MKDIDILTIIDEDEDNSVEITEGKCRYKTRLCLLYVKEDDCPSWLDNTCEYVVTTEGGRVESGEINGIYSRKRRKYDMKIKANH